MKVLISLLAVGLFSPAISFADGTRFQCQGQSPTEGYFEIHQFEERGLLTNMLVKTHTGLIVSLETRGPHNFPAAEGDFIYGITREGANLKLTALTRPDSTRNFTAAVEWPKLGAGEIKVSCTVLH